MRSTLRSLFAFMAIMGMLFGTLTLQVSAQTANQCPAYGDGTGASGGTPKIDVNEDGIQSLIYTAPEGFLIDFYCVKAGSVNNDLGPQVVPVDPPAKSVTIQYWDAAGNRYRDISHYSVHLIPDTTTQGEWCSPGYWRQPQHLDSWGATGYLPGDSFSAVFGVTSVKQGKTTIDVSAATLLDVLQGPETYGGNAFNMVGDLLSEAHPDVDFTGERVEDSCPLN